MNISIQTRAFVASQILSGLIIKGVEGGSAIPKAVRLTEDLIEALQRQPHGSFPDEVREPASNAGRW